MSSRVPSPPLLKKLTQVGMVVRDVEVAAKRYWKDLGIGPWQFYTLDPSNMPAMTLRGIPVRHAFRAALAVIGDITLELIEPLSGESVYAEYLAAHGEGLHHVAFQAADLERVKAHLKERGYATIQGGRPFDASSYVYFDTDKRLGCLIELGSREEGKSFPPPQLIYP